MNPLNQMRALLKRRGEAKADQNRVDPATVAPFETGDTQQIPLHEPTQPRSRRRLGAGLVAGAVVGLAAGFTIPALAGGNTPATSDKSSTSSSTPGAGDKAPGAKNAAGDAKHDKKAKNPGEKCHAPHALPKPHHKGGPASKDGAAAPAPKTGDAKELPPATSSDK